ARGEKTTRRRQNRPVRRDYLDGVARTLMPHAYCGGRVVAVYCDRGVSVVLTELDLLGHPAPFLGFGPQLGVVDVSLVLVAEDLEVCLLLQARALRVLERSRERVNREQDTSGAER